MTYTITTTHETETFTNVITNNRLTVDAVQKLKDTFRANATPGDTITHQVTEEN
jgi:hypothetical protein